MNPEEVQFLFAARIDGFEPILGQPTDAGLKQLCEELMRILLPLPFDVVKGIHDSMGLGMDKYNYKQRYWAKFPRTTKPAVYDDTIPNNATNVVWAKAEAVRTAKI